MVEARSLKVLRIEENRSTKEKVVRYTRQTAIGEENVDIASSWEEAVQVLEVLACRGDREQKPGFWVSGLFYFEIAVGSGWWQRIG